LSNHVSLTTWWGAVIIVASVVGGSVVCVIIAVFAWFFYRRKKHRLRFPDTFQDIDDIMRVESRPTLFSYSVLKKATKNFHISNKLGEGGFGSVFKGVLTDGTEVAVKQLSVGSKQGNDEFLNEVVLITSVQHRNLVKLQGCCLKGDERILVYEFLPNKSLHQALFDEEQVLHLDWLTRMKIILGTAQGLSYLHEGCRTRIIHRDIKASNILLDEDYNPKIADFGLARFFLDSQTHVSTRVAGTKGYLAPEYALRGQLTEKADVFSFGVVVLELISGRSNFDLRLPSDTAYLLDWASFPTQ
jgi:serine/threonine protein kinase